MSEAESSAFGGTTLESRLRLGKLHLPAVQRWGAVQSTHGLCANWRENGAQVSTKNSVAVPNYATAAISFTLLCKKLGQELNQIVAFPTDVLVAAIHIFSVAQLRDLSELRIVKH